MELVASSETFSVSPQGFEVGFVGVDGREVRQRLDLVRLHAFEDVAAVRSFPSFCGQRNNTGWWWLATTGRHVGFESWLERDLLIALDFDPVVVGVSSQPFWLFWHDGHRERAHAPDYFARLGDGTGVVVDCRPVERIRPRDAAAFAATEQACAQLGWRYELVHELEAVRTANLQWLAGYRHPRCRRDDLARAAVELAEQPRGLLELAQLLGDPVGTLPVVFHLLWCGQLQTNLATLLSPDALLTHQRPETPADEIRVG